MVEGRGRENDPIMTSLPIPIPMAAQRETVYYTFLKIFLHIEENETHKVDLINPIILQTAWVSIRALLGDISFEEYWDKLKNCLKDLDRYIV